MSKEYIRHITTDSSERELHDNVNHVDEVQYNVLHVYEVVEGSSARLMTPNHEM